MTCDVVILAAGKGTRMKSSTPKVLHNLGGKPFVMHSVETANEVTGHTPVLIVGHEADAVIETIGNNARFAHQREQLGTGHAVMQASSLLEGKGDKVIVLYADMPLLTSETLKKLLEAQEKHDGPFTILTLYTDTPRGFGRILRDKMGNVLRIIEVADATPDELAINEVNAGVYCFDADWLWKHLDEIKVSPKGEYYLTDLVEIGVRDNQKIRAVMIDDADELIGINTRVDLADAEAALRRRVNESLMLGGVTIIDPETTYIEPGVVVGEDTIIHPNTMLRGNTIIGKDCLIGPGSYVFSSEIGDGCKVFFSSIEEATMEKDCGIGPYGHLRKGAYLEEGVHMGNFGEVKNSRLKTGVKMGHFSYIGDSEIGDRTNIGAGTITCNFDGKRKHQTVTGEDVFIGSGTMLVAPVRLGEGAKSGAGSVVTKDVPAGEVWVGVPARPLRKKKENREE